MDSTSTGEKFLAHGNNCSIRSMRACTAEIRKNQTTDPPTFRKMSPSFVFFQAKKKESKKRKQNFNYLFENLKDLENFVLIDPASTLHNSVNHIQANSLRHYVDPSELVYVDWKMGHDTSNYLRLDTFTTASQKIRPENYIAEKSLLQKVYHPYDMQDLKAHRKFLKLVKKSYSSKYSSMFGTKREAII